MNTLAAKAEFAIRGVRWGEGIGGVEFSDNDFVRINEMLYYNSAEELAVRQDSFGRKMAELFSVPA